MTTSPDDATGAEPVGDAQIDQNEDGEKLQQEEQALDQTVPASTSLDATQTPDESLNPSGPDESTESANISEQNPDEKDADEYADDYDEEFEEPPKSPPAQSDLPDPAQEGAGAEEAPRDEHAESSEMAIVNESTDAEPAAEEPVATTEDLTAAVEEEPAPRAEEPAAAEDETAATEDLIAAERTVPAEETAVAAPEEAVAAEETAAATTEETVPAEETVAAPAEETAAATAEETTAPAVEETVAAEETAAPAEETVAAEETTAPAVEETVAAEETAAPAEETAAEETAAPAEETVAAEETAAPAEETVAAEETAAVEETAAAEETALAPAEETAPDSEALQEPTEDTKALDLSTPIQSTPVPTLSTPMPTFSLADLATKTPRDRQSAIITLTDLFKRIDVNESKNLEREELIRVFGDFADQFLQFCDVDANAEIDCEEWIRGIMQDTDLMTEQDFQREWVDRMRVCVEYAEGKGYGWYAGGTTGAPEHEHVELSKEELVLIQVDSELAEANELRKNPPPPTQEELSEQALEQQRIDDEEAKHQAVIRTGIFEMLVSRPLHSLKNRLVLCELDTDTYGKDKPLIADAVIDNSDPSELVNELKHDIGMLGITTLATNSAELAAQVLYALDIRRQRNEEFNLEQAANKKQKEDDEEAQRQLDKKERIKQAKIKKEREDKRHSLREKRRIEGLEWAATDQIKQEKEEKLARARDKLHRLEQKEQREAVDAKIAAHKTKSEADTEVGRVALHKMWDKEQAYFDKKCTEIQKAKVDQKKAERRHKKKLETEMQRESEEKVAALRVRMQAGMEKKRQVRDTWAKDQEVRKQRRDSLAFQEKAAARALAQRKKWVASEASDQKKARSDLSFQIRAERAAQNLQEQQAKSDRMVQHTELALHSAMVQKHEKMQAMQQLEQQWSSRVANRHNDYKTAWADEHRKTEMFRTQRNQQVGKYYRLQTADQGTVDVRLSRSGTTIGSRPVPSATAIHSASPMSVTADGRNPRLSQSHPLPYKYEL